MNISTNTISVLKNFSSINQSLAVDAGNTIRTISPQKTVMAVAQVDDTFDSSFAIYDLNQFLSAVSLFEKPDYDFEDQSVSQSWAPTLSNISVLITPTYSRESVKNFSMKKFVRGELNGKGTNEIGFI